MLSIDRWFMNGHVGLKWGAGRWMLLLAMLLLAGCARPTTVGEQVKVALAAHFGESYVVTVSSVEEGQEVDVLVQWLAVRGPSAHGLELMVPEEADHAIWDVLAQGLTPEALAKVRRVYFERVE